MRISDCAELTGTTVRTVRYYHQIGLLPVPAQRAGRRDYELEHIARILRIRWLVDAGMSLDTVATTLDAEPEDAAADLRATADSLDARIAELETQRERVRALCEMAESGRELRALPPAVDALYERIDARIDDPRTRAAVRREQRVAEMFAQRGLLPAAVGQTVDALDESDLDLVAEFYHRYARLADLDRAAAEREMDALVALFENWVAEHPATVRHMLETMPPVLRSRHMQGPLRAFFTVLATNSRQRTVLLRLLPLVTVDPKEFA